VAPGDVVVKLLLEDDEGEEEEGEAGCKGGQETEEKVRELLA